MKTVKVEIPEGYEIDKEKSSIENGNIVFKKIQGPPTTFEEVCERMGEDPDKYDCQFEFETEADAAARKIKLIVKYFNKGEALDWDSSKQNKYYPWFDLRNKAVSLIYVDNFCRCSHVPPSFCFVRKADAEYAVKTFINIYKQMFQ